MEIQVPYLLIMQELSRHSFRAEIDVGEARKVINLRFRVGRENLTPILNEMKKLGLIEYKNHKLLVLKWIPA